MENESRLRFIWRQLEYALAAFEGGRRLPSPDIVMEIINNNNTELAQAVIANYELIHPNNVTPE